MENWNKTSFTELISDRTKDGIKLPINEYNQSGLTAIIDQGQEFIAGYSDETEGAFTDVPAIIFGDHIRVFKYVDFPFFLGADGVKVLKANQEINYKYLYYYFLQAKLPNTGYARHFKWLKELQIPLPPLETQENIAAVLDKCTALIAKHKLMLEKYDTLIKSRFIEMFGDEPVENRKWKVEKLGNLGLCKNGMNFSYEDNGFEINCLGVGDFKDNAVISNCEKLPVISLNEKPSEEYLLKDNDIVFVRSNGNKELVGRSVLVHPRVLTTFSGFCIRFRLSTDSINHLFLLQFLKMPNTRKNMAGRGANIQNLNQQILSNLDIPVPPISLQNDFAAFVQQIDKSKFENNYKELVA